MRALISGVSGIRSHQVRLDVIGNNIANVNTNGFKSSRVTFQDVFSQTLSSGSAQTSPQQIGLGAGVATTDLNQAVGSFQLTGRELDLAIEGGGMFILRGSNGQAVYTRTGNFDWDANGYLVNPATGQRVQGWTADQTGIFGNFDAASLSEIQLTRGGVTIAQPTTQVTMGGNLDAGAQVGDAPVRTTMTAYDSLGRAHTLVIEFTRVEGENAWEWNVYGPPGEDGEPTPLEIRGANTINFTTSGLFDAGGGDEFSQVDGELPGFSLQLEGAADLEITLDFAGLTQAFAGQSGSTVLVRKADGYPMGTLETVTVDTSGQIYGVFSNGFRRPLAQLALANFANPGGLLKVGANGFSESASSGAALVGAPGTGGMGRLVPGNLEMSNVDLSTEFTSMIMTQRGFQANTRVISAADEMLQDLVNLRR